MPAAMLALVLASLAITPAGSRAQGASFAAHLLLVWVPPMLVVTTVAAALRKRRGGGEDVATLAGAAVAGAVSSAFWMTEPGKVYRDALRMTPWARVLAYDAWAVALLACPASVVASIVVAVALATRGGGAGSSRAAEARLSVLVHAFIVFAWLAGALLVAWAPHGIARMAIVAAAGRGDVEGVRRLLRAGADIETRCPDDAVAARFSPEHFGDTPLLAAAKSGSEEVVRFLLERGADPAATDRSGRSSFDVALTPAVRRLLAPHAPAGRRLDLLLGADARPDAIDAAIAEAGWPEPASPAFHRLLHGAIEIGDVPRVDELVARGGSLRGTLLLATKHPEMVARALRAGDDPDGASGSLALAPLALACAGGNLAVVRLLLEAGASPDAELGAMQPVVLLASTMGHWDVVAALMDAGADLHLDDGRGATLLGNAAASAPPEIVARILAAGTHPLRQHGRSGNPRQIAVSCCRLEIAGMLAEAGY